MVTWFNTFQIAGGFVNAFANSEGMFIAGRVLIGYDCIPNFNHQPVNSCGQLICNSLLDVVAHSAKSLLLRFCKRLRIPGCGRKFQYTLCSFKITLGSFLTRAEQNSLDVLLL